MNNRPSRVGSLVDRMARAALQYEPARAFLTGIIDAAGYDIAKRGRATADWLPNSTSAIAEVQEAAGPARDRTHDLIRNNGLARRGKQVLQSRLVGGGLTPIARREWLDLWNAWSPNCNASGRDNIEGMQTMCVGAVAESGEVYGRRRWRRLTDTGWDGRQLAVPLQIQIIEADQVDSTKNNPFDGGRDIDGFRFNLIGRPVGVWFFKEHPGDPVITTTESTLVPYEDLFHLWGGVDDRPGQIRGMTWFHAAGLQMRRLQRYTAYELERKETEATTVGVVETADNVETPDFLADAKDADAVSRLTAKAVIDKAGRVLETFHPRQLLYLLPGWRMKFNTPTPVQGYAEYVGDNKHDVAMALGIPHYSLSGNLSQVNFASSRIGDVDCRGWTVPWVEQRLEVRMMDVIALWFTEAAIASGKLRGKVEDWLPTGWQPGSQEEADRESAAKADSLELRNRLTSIRRVLQRRHKSNPDEVLAEIAAEIKTLAALGIISNADPNTTTDVGGPRYQQAPQS